MKIICFFILLTSGIHLALANPHASTKSAHKTTKSYKSTKAKPSSSADSPTNKSSSSFRPSKNSYVEQCLKSQQPDQACNTLKQNLKKWQPNIEETSKRVDIDPLLITALVGVESHFNASARSPSGAIGLTQILPTTAHKMGFNKGDIDIPETNLVAGALYLKVQLYKYKDNYRSVLAYNLGGKVKAPNSKLQESADAYAAQVISLYGYLQSSNQTPPEDADKSPNKLSFSNPN